MSRRMAYKSSREVTIEQKNGVQKQQGSNNLAEECYTETAGQKQPSNNDSAETADTTS